MRIELHNIKPAYMSESEIEHSDVYLQDNCYFEKGKKYLLKAASGHGKSSLLNFIYGSNAHYEGRIKYVPLPEGKHVFHLRQTSLSYVFQDYKLFPQLTTFENIQLKNRLSNHKTINEIDKLIEEMGLSHKRDTLLQKLSLGQQQRIAIIRALCQPFDFLLLDEPFSHLDKENIKTAVGIIDREIAQKKAGLILTSLTSIDYFKFDKVLNL